MMSLRYFILAPLLAVLSIAGAAAASEHVVVATPTVTRLVHIFSDMESQLIDAATERDGKHISDLLSPNFEMRVSTMPGNPVPRAAWIKQMLAEPKSASSLEHMAVHDLGGTAVVSYTWNIKRGTHDISRQVFIVDIWTDAGSDAWHLAVRYASAVGKDRIGIPGAAYDSPVLEKKE